MDKPSFFTLEEYYLWRNLTDTKVPWKRQYLNQEFLNYEKRRINEVFKWRAEFLKKSINQNLGESSFYVIPLELPSFWKASVDEKGDFWVVGLSALQNSPIALTIALIPKDNKKPEDYNLIQLIKSKKSEIHNKRENLIEFVAVIEKWDYLKPDKIYLDLPTEKNYIKKILRETLAIDDNLAISMQSPFLSSPSILGIGGGIAFSSLANNYAFSHELIKTIMRMIPPEYREIDPPINVFKGTKFDYFSGIKFHFAERPQTQGNLMKGVPNSSYNQLYYEIDKKKLFGGEYSIFSTINSTLGEDTSREWQELMKRFTCTEVTIPKELDELEEFAMLPKLKKAIGTEMWAQVVASRQLFPSIKQEHTDIINKTLLRLREDIDIHLSDIHKDEAKRKSVVDSMSSPLSENIRRLAQSFARADNRGVINSNDFSNVRDLVLDNFTGFLNHQNIKSLKMKMESRKENVQYNLLKTLLIDNPNSNSREIFELVKNYGHFTDIYEVQKWLDWMHGKGHVIRNAEGRYTFI